MASVAAALALAVVPIGDGGGSEAGAATVGGATVVIETAGNWTAGNSAAPISAAAISAAEVARRRLDAEDASDDGDGDLGAGVAASLVDPPARSAAAGSSAAERRGCLRVAGGGD